MTSVASTEITRLLKAWGAGDRAALDSLIPKVYTQLRRMAQLYIRKERPGITLDSTALVNEAYLRLVGVEDIEWQERAHFFAVAAQTMRRILVDAARARSAAKRGGRREGHLSAPDFNKVPDLSSQRDSELVAIDEALQELAKVDARKARVIELRFFGGLSTEETAAVLKISSRTVKRDWTLARAWIARELSRGGVV